MGEDRLTSEADDATLAAAGAGDPERGMDVTGNVIEEMELGRDGKTPCRGVEGEAGAVGKNGSRLYVVANEIKVDVKWILRCSDIGEASSEEDGETRVSSILIRIESRMDSAMSFFEIYPSSMRYNCTAISFFVAGTCSVSNFVPRGDGEDGLDDDRGSVMLGVERPNREVKGFEMALSGLEPLDVGGEVKGAWSDKGNAGMCEPSLKEGKSGNRESGGKGAGRADALAGSEDRNVMTLVALSRVARRPVRLAKSI